MRFLLAPVLVLVLFVSASARAGGDASRVWRGLECIHTHEGAWNDPNGPYWGGLQMDMTFMQTYGKEFLQAYGTADHWSPAIQMVVAMRAYLSGRGFSPWPNTARMCGLS